MQGKNGIKKHFWHRSYRNRMDWMKLKEKKTTRMNLQSFGTNKWKKIPCSKEGSVPRKRITGLGGRVN